MRLDEDLVMQQIEDFTEPRHYLKAPVSLRIVRENCPIDIEIGQPKLKKEKTIIDENVRRIKRNNTAAELF